MEFRKIKINEITEVYKIYCLEENIEIKNSEIKTAKKIYKKMLSNGSYTFGCFIENKLVGVINVNKILDYYPNYQKYPYAHLETFIVHKEYQGQGIGTKLIQNAINLLKKEGISYIIAQSRVEGAKRAFQKAGMLNENETDFRINFIK